MIEIFSRGFRELSDPSSLQAGVDGVQIFDTWAGVLPPVEFRKWCIEPCARIVAAVRNAVPKAKIIGFPRGAGTKLTDYVAGVAVDAVGLDWMIELGFARERIQTVRPVQGNLDPLALLVGGAALDRAIDRILEAFAGGPFIFNLGPWRAAGNADRACRAIGRAGPRQPSQAERHWRFCERERRVDDLSMDQGVPHHRGHRLDGGNALSAAAVRLSLRAPRKARSSRKPSR